MDFFFRTQESIEPAGTHVIMDLYNIDVGLCGDMEFWKTLLKDACTAAHATILEERFHHFGNGFGITGVLILAESHASVHTWPEKNFAAIDIFMCGKCDPEVAAYYIRSQLGTAEQFTIYRGNKN